MNLKIQAMKKTAKMVAIATLSSFLLLQLLTIPPEILVWGLFIGFSAFMVWIVYSIVLGQLQAESQEEKNKQ